MHRSKKILLVSHCLLNVNAKIHKLGNYEGVLDSLIIPLIKQGYGFIQLPCPEMYMYGAKRWGQVKDQYDTPFFKRNSQMLLDPIIEQLLDYQKNDYNLCGCIGIDGSPSCGVHKSCRGEWGGEIDSSFVLEEKLASLKSVNERGVFMEVLNTLLNQHGLSLPFYAVDEANPLASVQNILKELS